jgi:NADH dehydrogenase [ubiquinone] 1 alpha subcomplex assembly factor 6
MRFNQSFRDLSLTKKHEFDLYCLNLVKSRDYENYLCGLLYPKFVQGLFFAIRAFNVEIATIKDQIPSNNIHAGRIRFQWWRDVLDGINVDKELPMSFNQPVAQALGYYIRKFDFQKRWLERSLESRYLSMRINNSENVH